MVEALDNAAWNAYIESIIDGWLKAHEAKILTPQEVQDALYRWIAEPYSLRTHRDALQQYVNLPIRDDNEQELYVAITGVYHELTLNTLTLRMLRLFQEPGRIREALHCPRAAHAVAAARGAGVQSERRTVLRAGGAAGRRYPFLAETHARKMRLLLEQVENYQKQAAAEPAAPQ